MEVGKTYKTKFQTEEKFTIEKINTNTKGEITKVWGWYENSPNLKMCPLSPERLQTEKETMSENKLNGFNNGRDTTEEVGGKPAPLDIKDIKERINYIIDQPSGMYVGQSVNIGCVCQAKTLENLKLKMKAMIQVHLNLYSEIIEQEDCFELKEMTLDEWNEYSGIKHINNKDYSQQESFWIRLKDFVHNVQVNDAMSQEEKDMILNICKEKIKQ